MEDVEEQPAGVAVQQEQPEEKQPEELFSNGLKHDGDEEQADEEALEHEGDNEDESMSDSARREERVVVGVQLMDSPA